MKNHSIHTRLRRKLARLAGLTLLGGGLWATVALGRAVSREYDVKAVFLYNFATFGEWPQSAFSQPDSPFVIGVIGTDPFGAALEQIVEGERIRGRPIVIRRFGRKEEISGCHILFISASEKWRLREILQQCQDLTVLTVADIPGFVEKGGLVGFVTTNRVGIKVNPAALRSAHLGLSPKLLRLAQVVSLDPSAP